MFYYKKYLIYKNKYLELKNQIGGLSFCEKAYKNILGTCWAVAILTMLTFGQATSNDLNIVILSILGNDINSFIKQRILELQSMHELMNFCPHNIFDDTYRIYLENIMNKFIVRYNSKINSPEKPENIVFDKSNPERCELVIAQNFKKLFKHPILQSNKYGGNLVHQYLFSNLLSVFFFKKKVSFTNYYNNLNLINFDVNKDIGILMQLEDHVCCLYICDCTPKYYNDMNKRVYDCPWQDILSKSTNLYIRNEGNLTFIDYDSYVKKENLNKVLYLTVISKHPKVSALDIEIENILKSNYSNINQMELQSILGDMFSKEEDMKEAVRWYRLAADQGDTRAQNNLGAMLAKGEGVAEDKAEAIQWFRLAVDKGYLVAQLNLGIILSKSEVTEEKAEAVKLLRLVAKRGNVNAQFKLGVMLENGNGVAQDKIEAARLFRLAAEQKYPGAVEKLKHAALHGDTNAQYNLGKMLLKGLGVAQDTAEAKKLLNLAAEHGNVEAKFELGNMLLRGLGVAQNKVEAERLFRLAAEQGNADAQFELGFMLTRSSRTVQDKAEVARLYRLAAAQGHQMALHQLLFGAMLGNKHAKFNLGVMYENGEGVEVNKEEAKKMYKEAAEQGHTDARVNLDIMLSNKD
jgi:TPR repeat protein